MMTPEQLIDASFVIINGYALQKIEKGIRVVNIHKPNHAAVFSSKGELLETNMDDIELHIAQKYYAKGMGYLEEDDAEVL